jgi:hypothetical protein
MYMDKRANMSTPFAPSIADPRQRLDACTSALALYEELQESNDLDKRAKSLHQLQSAAKGLYHATKPPAQGFMDVRNGGQKAAALRIGIEIELFDHISETKALSISRSAQLTDATPEFVHRIARALAALGFLTETEDSATNSVLETSIYDRLSYKATSTATFGKANKHLLEAPSYIYDVRVGAICSMGDYLTKYGRQSPKDPPELSRSLCARSKRYRLLRSDAETSRPHGKV